MEKKGKKRRNGSGRMVSLWGVDNVLFLDLGSSYVGVCFIIFHYNL